MRTWIADRLDALATWIRGEGGVPWGALVSGDSVYIRKGQPINLTVNDGHVTLDTDAIPNKRPAPSID